MLNMNNPHKIYRGKIFHERLNPREHRFSYASTFFQFDISKLDLLNKKYIFFGYNTPSIIELRDRDYLQGKNEPLEKQISEFFTYEECNEKTILFTSPRYLGMAFNPVNFYFRINKKLEILQALVEVNNTFGDRHIYLLRSLTRNKSGYYTSSCKKNFHVSPFNSMDGSYKFNFFLDKNYVFLGIDLYKEDSCIMRTYLKGFSHVLNEKTCIKYCLLKPFDTAINSMPRIIFQAFKLLLQKKLKIYERPNPSSEYTLIDDSKNKDANSHI